MQNAVEARHGARARTTAAIIGLTTAALAASLAVASTAHAQPGLGARYGTRDPRACPDRRAPARGTPSPAQIAQYVQCEGEGSYGTQGRLGLMENMRVQVGAGRPYQHVQDSYEDIDPRQLVYPIRGSFTSYSCDQIRSAREMASGYADNRGKNCDTLEEPHASGVCFKSTFAEWHCTMVDIKADVVRDTKRGVAPPRG